MHQNDATEHFHDEKRKERRKEGEDDLEGERMRLRNKRGYLYISKDSLVV